MERGVYVENDGKLMTKMTT